MSNVNVKNYVKNLFLTTIGCIMYAIGIQCFAAPHNIAPGGVSGIAIMLNYLFNIPIGFFTFIVNIPLIIIILVRKYFNKTFIVNMLIASTILSIITDFILLIVPTYKGDPLLAAIFSGAIMGIGLALVHLGEMNTGGVSLMGLMIHEERPEFHVGTLITVLNMSIVILSTIIYKNIESMLYATVTVYISGVFMDKLLDNASHKSLMLVISECTDKVKDVFVKYHAGSTILKGEGNYSGRFQRVILCVVKKQTCEDMQKEIKQVDPHALTIITEASKVEGKGFRHIM